MMVNQIDISKAAIMLGVLGLIGALLFLADSGLPSKAILAAQLSAGFILGVGVSLHLYPERWAVAVVVGLAISAISGLAWTVFQ